MTGQAAHQSSFTNAVGADDRDTLTGLYRETDLVEYSRLCVRIPEAQLLNRHSRAVEFLGLLEPDIGVLPRRGLDFLDLDLLQQSFARSRLPRLGGVGREAPHEFLQVGDLIAGLGIRGFHALARLHRGQHKIIVVAGIDLELLIIQVGDMRAHLIEEMTVMTDDNHGGFIVIERAFKPTNRMDIQIVGRLIEQQHVGPGEQRLSQQHP